MHTDMILQNLKEQRDRLNAAIQVLAGEGESKRDGRRRGRRLSVAAKKRISVRMKQAWALRKKREKVKG